MAAVNEVEYWWHEAPVPAGLEITQVYGYLLCPVTARVLMQDDGGVFNLPGGTPEPEDHGDLVATLVREAGSGVSAVSIAITLPGERAEGKVQPWHRDRLAVVYVRQSTDATVSADSSTNTIKQPDQHG